MASRISESLIQNNAALMELQSQYNQMRRDKNYWRKLYNDTKSLMQQLANVQENTEKELREEITRLSELLDRATRSEALETTARRKAKEEDAARIEA